MSKAAIIPLTLIIGIALGAGLMWKGYRYIPSSGSHGATEADVPEEQELKPLYWVAPMDPNYRKDKPGQSPMGMDLIPVYEEDNSGPDAGPGTIKISPDVVNNLGVRTAPATKASLHSSIQTVGYVKYDEDQLVHIHPRVEGWIDKLYIKASGDPVKMGQPLYEIYSPSLVNAQEELLLALDRKQARLIGAAERRLQALRVPASIIKRIKKEREVRQSITFYAPKSGVVNNLKIRQGFYVKPGSTLMSIGVLEQVWVEAEVFERQVSLVQVGMAVSMTLDYLPGREWEGRVDYIYPSLDPKTRTLRVRLRFANRDKLLKPDMFAQVVIHSESSDTPLIVPQEAVIRSGRSNRVVLALGEGKFKSINVKLGRIDDSNVEILSGLSENEKVVTSAQFLIDSESSKTSDFMRINHSEETLPEKVWVMAVINELETAGRKLNVTHKEIKAWKWGEMTMDFIVDDTVEMAALKKGLELDIQISKKGEGQYVITGTHIPGSDENKSLDDLSSGDMSLDGLSLDDSDDLKN